jgi:hypothetical protein
MYLKATAGSGQLRSPTTDRFLETNHWRYVTPDFFGEARHYRSDSPHIVHGLTVNPCEAPGVCKLSQR